MAEAATARALDRLETVAADDLPGDIATERVEGGLRLTGPRLLLRWLGDVRLHGLVASATRGRR